MWSERKNDMRKRILIGLLTLGMLFQSVSVPALTGTVYAAERSEESEELEGEIREEQDADLEDTEQTSSGAEDGEESGSGEAEGGEADDGQGEADGGNGKDDVEKPDPEENPNPEPEETDDVDPNPEEEDTSDEEDPQEEIEEDTDQVSGNDVGEENILAEVLGADAEIKTITSALDLENLTAEYTALDGRKISSKAEGKPKLLIFYRDGCRNCINTISGVSSRIDDFSGVDLYAIEAQQAAKETVAAFQKTYGCDEIIFSYDTGWGNNNSLWDYVNRAGLSSDQIITPVMMYIDAGNRLQYASTSYVSADTVLSNLKKYCDYRKRYTITYVLSGGRNDSANPDFYSPGTEKIVLQNAVRDGQKFEGWYQDPDYSVRVTEITNEMAKDITLYAKWSPLTSAGVEEIVSAVSAGNVIMGFSGSYYTESAEKILNRLNAIRLEACRQGVLNPSTGEPLTEADYVPLYWSAALEAIARQRAAEAAVEQAHTRPNGQSCFSVKTLGKEQSWGENLAWNSDGLMKGIEQWYAEKNDWVKQNGKETGHYESIINPGNRCVGLSAFRLSSGGLYAVAQEFSNKDTLNAYKNAEQGNCVQYMEVSGSKITGLEFDKALTVFIKEGESYQVPLLVSVKYADYSGRVKSFSGPYREGGTWSSSEETVAAVDSTGMINAKAQGTAKISVTAGSKSAAFDLTVYDKNGSPIRVKPPTVTTYKIGQKLNIAGGKVSYPVGGKIQTKILAANMLSGFDSSKPGICSVTVTCEGYTASFDTLIVEEPKLQASYGQKLSDIPLPENDYGTYSWTDAGQIMDRIGVRTFNAEYIPNEGEKFQELTLQMQVTTKKALGEDAQLSFRRNSFTYNGAEQQPGVIIIIPGSASLGTGDLVLIEGTDYTLSYENNINAGMATLIVEGIGYYTGSLRKNFVITPAQVLIKAKDKTILLGDTIPAVDEYEYQVSGLAAGDSLQTAPVLTSDITRTDVTGRYVIVPNGADAGMNYKISYENGSLTVAREGAFCAVTFDVQGHGTAPKEQIGIKVGDTAEKPADPSAEGYRFDGWYRDIACTKAWNFDADIVQSDVVLYAKWLCEGTGSDFAVQEIAEVYYTGKAYKPTVSVYDGEMLLRSGRDYQVKYYNNINASNVQKQGNGTGNSFRSELPYVEIIGKGNYTDTVKVNFNILPAVIGNGGTTPSAGVTLKVSDQLAVVNRVQKPFSSVRSAKAMKQGVDYTIELTVLNARDRSGRSLAEGLVLENAAVPAGAEGEFLLTVKGIGNYTGSICKTIYVADKTYLMKNAKITLGKNLKNKEFTGEAVRLNPSETDSADTFTVKCGKTTLKYQRDYEVSYRNNDKVGKAELVVTGIGRYAGEKAVTFNIKGKAFSAKMVKIDGVENLNYTGKALTQNGVVLTYAQGTNAERELKYGTDYTISYTKNINKGTATMIFSGNPAAGYSGSIRKTFKISAADITQTAQASGMQNIEVKYSKAGTKPTEEIVLTNREGFRLVNGKDYTLSYKNNRAVADKTDQKPPTIIVKGRGNYVGQLTIGYTITRGDLERDAIQIKTSAMAYQNKKAATYAYKPAVKLMDGKSALRAGTDYEIAYVNNTQAEIERYLQYEQGLAMKGQRENPEDTQGPPAPRAVITEKLGSNYAIEKPISILLPIYQNKLTKANLIVEIEETEKGYTGKQVTPTVTVYYKVGDDAVLMTEGEDYLVSYGTNIASGKNRGSVIISGMAPYYGGAVTVQFNIERKPIF